MKSTESLQPVRVWDPFIRIFHWTLALFFTAAYLTEDDFEQLHFYLGYAIIALLCFRIIWGLIGPEHARFTGFVTGIRPVISYLKSLLSGAPQHYLGHNPAGGLMVLALLGMLGLTCFCGISLLAIDGEGPMAGTFLASLNEDLVEELHEWAANATVGLVLIHIAGVIVSSLLHRENLIRAMITGVKWIRR